MFSSLKKNELNKNKINVEVSFTSIVVSEKRMKDSRAKYTVIGENIFECDSLDKIKKVFESIVESVARELNRNEQYSYKINIKGGLLDKPAEDFTEVNEFEDFLIQRQWLNAEHDCKRLLKK